MSHLISVVIPSYDRPAQLDACLDALGRSTYPREGFEVVVVDDGSPTPLDDIVARHARSLRIALERQPNAGPAAARNRGAAVARGSVLAFTDDDCTPEPNWLTVLARHVAERPGHMIGGRAVNVLTSNPFSSASQHLVSYLYEYGLKSAGTLPWTGFFASNNLAVPAAEFQRVGGFDVDFPLAAGEDRDFCARWNEAGLPAHYAPDAVILHRHRLGLRSFWKQHWNYGRGAFHFHQARAGRGGGPLRPEPLGFYVGMLRYPFRHESLARGAVHAKLLGMAQFANALGYFREKYASPARRPGRSRGAETS
jgi:GT2 family glycosyltransferase